MKFSSTLVAFATLVASVSALPSPRGSRAPKKPCKNNKGMGMAMMNMGMGSAVSMNNGTQGSNSSVGAAYMITNEPSGNFVVSMDINSDGTLALVAATYTGGLGQHGNDGGVNGSDPLFGQGSVKVSAAANLLAAVNPGSNTISLFSIDPNTPSTLTPVGAPVGSGGEFPMSVAFNAAGDSLCALNGGAVNGVACFSIDKQLGLVPRANSVRSLGLNQTTPASGPAGSTSHLIFSEDQSTLFAAVKGNPAVNATGFIAAWDVQQDGSLSPQFTMIAPPSGGNLPFSFTNIPGKNNSLFVTDAAVGVDIFDLSNGVQNAAKSSATASLPIEGQGAVCWSAFSKKTNSFFVTDIKTNLVTEVAVDDNLKSNVVKQYETQSGAATIDLEVGTAGGNDFLYVNMANATSVQAFSLPAQGQATKLQTLDIAGPAQAAGLQVSGSLVQGMTVFLKPQ